ncbi:hypothetical protein HYX04_00485 [Candidatus Woesearchaeota archaeon]|nr:hypothetical protein [Candidatus Woesearchaeota archaeon]
MKGENIERNTDAKIKCYKCGNEYAMNMMRMDPNGRNLACRNCLERKSIQKGQVKTEIKPQKQDPMKEYFCKACKYNFSRAKRLALTTCPYCSASGSLMVKGSTAKIMADSFKMKGDF